MAEDEYAQCFDCGKSMVGIVDWQLRIYCECCVERLDLKRPEEYRTSVALISLKPPANR